MTQPTIHPVHWADSAYWDCITVECVMHFINPPNQSEIEQVFTALKQFDEYCNDHGDWRISEFHRCLPMALQALGLITSYEPVYHPEWYSLTERCEHLHEPLTQRNHRNEPLDRYSALWADYSERFLQFYNTQTGV